MPFYVNYLFIYRNFIRLFRVAPQISKRPLRVRRRQPVCSRAVPPFPIAALSAKKHVARPELSTSLLTKQKRSQIHVARLSRPPPTKHALTATYADRATGKGTAMAATALSDSRSDEEDKIGRALDGQQEKAQNKNGRRQEISHNPPPASPWAGHSGDNTPS